MANTKQGTEPFIKFYNVFSESDSNYHLSHEELYLYGLLKIYSLIDGRTVTTISVLHEVSPLKFLAVDKKSKNRIKESILSLRDKGVIIFNEDDIGINTPLQISFPEDLSDSNIGKGISGFEPITFKLFNSFRNIRDLQIYFTVKRFDKLGGYKASNERWSRVLILSEKRTRSILKEAVDNRIIYKNIGDYKEDKVESRSHQKVQDNNTYKTTPFATVEKSSMTKNRESRAAYDKLKIEYEDNDLLEENIEIFFRRKDEFGTSIYPDVEDYLYFLEVEDKLKNREGSELEKEFMKIAKNRIKYMKNNPKFTENWARAESIFNGEEDRHEEAIPVLAIKEDYSKLDIDEIF